MALPKCRKSFFFSNTSYGLKDTSIFRWCLNGWNRFYLKLCKGKSRALSLHTWNLTFTTSSGWTHALPQKPLKQPAIIKSALERFWCLVLSNPTIFHGGYANHMILQWEIRETRPNSQYILSLIWLACAEVVRLEEGDWKVNKYEGNYSSLYWKVQKGFMTLKCLYYQGNLKMPSAPFKMPHIIFWPSSYLECLNFKIN